VPALNDLINRPSIGLTLVYMQYDMIVVRHNGIGTDINGKYGGQRDNSIFDPFSAMLITDAVIIIAA
jgi:hypothetical protein